MLAMQWLDEIRSALDREFGGSSRVMVMATVDAAGAPHARCLVCRGIDDEGRVFAATDARTEKNSQLRADRRAEAVFWLPKMRAQYRVQGEVKLVAYPEDEALRKEVWRGMSSESRALLFWPTPGIARASDDAFAQAVSGDVPPPETFEVLVLQPRQVDRLSLDSVPHRRRIWRASNHWAGVDVNP